MALPECAQGSTHSSLLVTCLRRDSSVLDLTGSTITAKLKNKATAAVSTVTGTLSLVSPTGGQFRWTFSAADVGTVGFFKVQFTATYGDTTVERSIAEDWEVTEAF